jgi:hypothetical protein
LQSEQPADVGGEAIGERNGAKVEWRRDDGQRTDLASGGKARILPESRLAHAGLPAAAARITAEAAKVKPAVYGLCCKKTQEDDFSLKT